MAGRSTKRVQNSQQATFKKLEEEAKNFSKNFSKDSTKDKSPDTEKPLTARQQLAGMILSGLLARSQGLISTGDLRREAYELADLMLEYD